MVYPELMVRRSSVLTSTSVDSVHLCDYDQANNSMSREQKIAAVEAYLDCFVTKNVSEVPFAQDVTFWPSPAFYNGFPAVSFGLPVTLAQLGNYPPGFVNPLRLDMSFHVPVDSLAALLRMAK